MHTEGLTRSSEIRVEIEGAPVKLSATSALDVFVPAGIRDVFHKMGVTSRRWF
jgi:hypothetical protein